MHPVQSLFRPRGRLGPPRDRPLDWARWSCHTHQKHGQSLVRGANAWRHPHGKTAMARPWRHAPRPRHGQKPWRHATPEFVMGTGWSKNREKLSDRKVALNPAPEHPAAPAATEGDATTLPDALELPSTSLRGSGATQTSTSPACASHAVRGRDRAKALSRRTRRRIARQVAVNLLVAQTTQPIALEPMPRRHMTSSSCLCSCEPRVDRTDESMWSMIKSCTGA